MNEPATTVDLLEDQQCDDDRRRVVELLRPVKDDIALALGVLGSGGDADAPLIPGGGGGQRDPDDYKNWRRRHFRPAVRDLGLSIRRPYDLRHTSANDLPPAELEALAATR